MGKPSFAGFLPLLWRLLLPVLFAFALVEEMPPLPLRFRQYRAEWLPFSLHARWAWAQRRFFISALVKTSCLSEGFKSQLRKERKESHMQ